MESEFSPTPSNPTDPGQMQGLEEWLEEIEQRHYQLTGKSIDLGLDRVNIVAEELGLFSHKPLRKKSSAKIVTVAGTNGKGSFVASADALFRQQGLKTACYTSPHILKFNERIVVNGESIDDTSLIHAFEKVDLAQAKHQIRLSFFEFTTLSAFVIFSDYELDVLLLEIGLGGRLDAVNIFEPDLAVITSIALDHQDFLGDDLNGIAAEKCGILRDKTPLILLTDQQLPALTDARKGREVLVLGIDFTLEQCMDDHTWQFEFDERLLQRKHVLGLQKALSAVQGQSFEDKGLAVSSQLGALISVFWMQDLFADFYLDSNTEAPTKVIQQSFEYLSLPGTFPDF